MLVSPLLNMTPKCSALGLSRVPKGKKAVMCLNGENVCIRYDSAVGCEFSVNESTIHIK